MERFAMMAGSSAEWALVGASLILARGEPGYDTTTHTLKVGDGSTVWNSLPTAASWNTEATLDNVADTATRAAVRPADATALADGNVTAYVISGSTSAEGKVQLAELEGTTSGTVVQADDPRLSDSRDPTLHASSHATGQSDAIAPSDIGAVVAGDISTAILAHSGDSTGVHGITDTSALVLTDDSRLSDNRTPTAHAESHATGESDAIAPSDIGAATAGDIATAVSEHSENVTSAHGLTIANVASKPKAATGVGEFKLISAGVGEALKTPATGSNWAYFICCWKNDGTLNLTTPFAAGIQASADTEIGAAVADHKWTGFTYRF